MDRQHGSEVRRRKAIGRWNREGRRSEVVTMDEKAELLLAMALAGVGSLHAYISCKSMEILCSDADGFIWTSASKEMTQMTRASLCGAQ